MGILDRFRAKLTPPPPPPPVPAPATDDLALPARATIQSYVLEDAVGTLELSTGGRIRFGRSACKEFEPVAGAAVIVERAEMGVRGWRATSVSLDDDDDGYGTLLDARDEQHGLPSRHKTVLEVAADARQFGVVTVLLKTPVPEGKRAIRQWLADLDVARHGIDARTERELELTMDGQPMSTAVGRCVFPQEELDTRNVSGDFDFGQSFVTLGSAVPGFHRLTREMTGRDADDPWRMGGPMRSLSRLARALAEHATGVVLHRAGDLVVEADEFVRMLGDLDDPECRPFAAWLDVSVTEGSGGVKLYASFGMDAFGLPDVATPVDVDSRWSRLRAHEAVLVACYRMVDQNRPLGDGELLRVPLCSRIGAWRPALDEDDAAFTYLVSDHGSRLRLEGSKAAPPSALWNERRGGRIAPNAYRALFDAAIHATIPNELVDDMEPETATGVPHRVQVRARDDGRGVMIVTNGVGRQPQPGVELDDWAHVELAAWVPEPHAALAELVGTLASSMHSDGSGAWRPGELLGAPIADLGIGGFLLADGGSVEMFGGPTVRLLLMVPLAPSHYRRVRREGAEAWLAKHRIDARRWLPFIEALR
jgi:hypothetical protein